MAPTLATLLRQERKSAGLTQEQLADRSGVAARTISDLERGVFQTARAATLRLLSDALELTGPRREAFLNVGSGHGSDAQPSAVFSRVRIPPTPLIGRDADTATIADLLVSGTSRVLTLTGIGGVGKTRLAASAAARAQPAFADGVRDVDAVPLLDSADLVNAIARAMASDPDSGQDIVDVSVLAERIGPRRVLLVLDNLEHLIDAAAAVVAALIAACPGISVLATSRVALRIRGEQEYAVAPLPVPPPDPADGGATAASVELFTWHAARRRFGWRPDPAALRHVAEVCRALDGLPLAIELAAERIGSLDPADIADALAAASGSLRLLADGPRDLPDRQRSMEASIRWTYGQLTEAARGTLRSMSVFPAGCRLDALRAVCGPQSVTAIAELVDHHQLHVQDTPSGLEYRLSQPVREFAAGRLAADGEAEAVRRRLTAYAVDLAESAEPHLTGPQQAVWLDRLTEAHDTLRAALSGLLAEGEGEQAVRLAGALWRFWYARGHIRAGHAWLRRALETLDADPVARDPRAPEACARLARALNGAASLESCLEQTAAVRALYERAIPLWERAGDRAGLAGTRSNLGMYEHYYGSAELARGLYRQAAAEAASAGHRRTAGAALVNLGQLLIGEGDLEEARVVLAEALGLFRECGDRRGQADTLGSLGELAMARHLPAEARGHAAAALVLFTELNDEVGRIQARLVIARAGAAEGDQAAVFDELPRIIEDFDAREYPWGAAEGVTLQAALALDRGDTAAAYLHAADAIARWASIDGAADSPDARRARAILAEVEGRLNEPR